VTDAQDGEGINIGENGKIQFPNNVSPDAAKFDLTVKPNWSGSDQTDNALIELRGEHDWSNRVELVKNGEFLRFIVTDNTGKESDISYRITDWQAGDPHNIQAQYGPCDNGPSNCTGLYVDGRKVGEKQYDGTLQVAPGTPLFVGGDHQTSSYGGFNGSISNFTISTPKFSIRSKFSAGSKSFSIRSKSITKSTATTTRPRPGRTMARICTSCWTSSG